MRREGGTRESLSSFPAVTSSTSLLSPEIKHASPQRGWGKYFQAPAKPGKMETWPKRILAHACEGRQARACTHTHTHTPCKQSLMLRRPILPKSTLSTQRVDKGVALGFSHLNQELAVFLPFWQPWLCYIPFHSGTRIQSVFSSSEALPEGGSSPPQPFSGSR